MDDPTVAFGLAVIALAASLLSGFGSIWALTQKWRYFPRPLLVRSTARHTVGREYDVAEGEYVEYDELLEFLVVNHGDGVAHDVHLTLHGPSGATDEARIAKQLAPGEPLSVRVVVADVPVREDRYGGVTLSTAGADPRSFSAVLTWRQAPHMRWVRKRRIREKRKSFTGRPAISD